MSQFKITSYGTNKTTYGLLSSELASKNIRAYSHHQALSITNDFGFVAHPSPVFANLCSTIMVSGADNSFNLPADTLFNVTQHNDQVVVYTSEDNNYEVCVQKIS